jgi:hypothetical protein
MDWAKVVVHARSSPKVQARKPTKKIDAGKSR